MVGIQLDKEKLGDQIILANFGGFLAIGDFFGRQYYLSNCSVVATCASTTVVLGA